MKNVWTRLKEACREYPSVAAIVVMYQLIIIGLLAYLCGMYITMLLCLITMIPQAIYVYCAGYRIKKYADRVILISSKQIIIYVVVALICTALYCLPTYWIVKYISSC